MVHLAFSNRDAISVTGSDLVLEDSARGKRVFGGLSKAGSWIFSEENHVQIIYRRWLNQSFTCREYSSGGLCSM
jgi:hypothetical protein